MVCKGHTGLIKVKRPTEKEPHGTLKIKVRINGIAANTGSVKDLKQLSGGCRGTLIKYYLLATEL